MANTINYTIPTIGSTADPLWESYVNTALTAISTHTHDGANAGASLLPTAISFASSGFNFNNKAQTNAAYYDMAQQGSPPANTAGHGSLYCDNSGNLYYISPSTNVQICTSSALSSGSASKGFVGSDYGSTGGAAFYNAASGTWPFTSTFYFYTSTSTPTNDTGSRAGLACGIIHHKGAAGTGCASYYTDSAGGTTERPWLGIIATSGGTAEFGLQTARAAGVGTNAPAFVIRETDNSVSNLGNTAPAAARTYGFYLNGMPSTGTASSVYHYGIRCNIPNVGNNTVSDIGYIVKNYTDGTGAAVATADGFGMRHRWHLQATATLGVGIVAAAQVTSWANQAARAGRHGIFVAGGGVILANPGFEVVYNAGGTNSIGIGQAADYATPTANCQIAMATTVNAALTATGLMTASASLVVTGTTTMSNTLTISGGGAAITGAVSGTSTGTFASVYPSSTATAPTASTGGIFKNTQVLAWVSSNSVGTVVAGYNVDNVSHDGTGQYTVHLHQPVTTTCCVILTANDGDTSNAWHAHGILASTSTVSVRVTENASTFADLAFAMVIIGLPG